MTRGDVSILLHRHTKIFLETSTPNNLQIPTRRPLPPHPTASRQPPSTPPRSPRPPLPHTRLLPPAALTRVELAAFENKKKKMKGEKKRGGKKKSRGSRPAPRPLLPRGRAGGRGSPPAAGRARLCPCCRLRAGLRARGSPRRLRAGPGQAGPGGAGPRALTAPPCPSPRSGGGSAAALGLPERRQVPPTHTGTRGGGGGGGRD